MNFLHRPVIDTRRISRVSLHMPSRVPPRVPQPASDALTAISLCLILKTGRTMCTSHNDKKFICPNSFYFDKNLLFWLSNKQNTLAVLVNPSRPVDHTTRGTYEGTYEGNIRGEHSYTHTAHTIAHTIAHSMGPMIIVSVASLRASSVFTIAVW